jgi:hypothetical protein
MLLLLWELRCVIVSDVGRYVIIRKLLDFTFNMLLVLKGGVIFRYPDIRYQDCCQQTAVFVVRESSEEMLNGGILLPFRFHQGRSFVY